MTRIALIDGHPDAAPDHLVHKLADAYAAGAESHHELRRIDVARLDFPLIRVPRDWQTGTPPPAIAEAQSAIRWAEHLVLIYPLWFGDVPALLKGFLEQVMRPNFAFGPLEGRFPKTLLDGRSARVVVTMGMPAPVYTLFYRAHSLKSLERNILRFAGMGPIAHSVLGGVESAKRRAKWLEEMRQLGVRAG